MVAAVRDNHDLRDGQRVCDEFVLDGVTSSPVGATVHTAHRAGCPEERFVVRVVPCADLAAMARFRRAMAHARRVEHRALAPIAAFEVGPRRAVVVQQAQGIESLRERLTRGPLSAATVGWLIAEVAAALDALHHAQPPIVHGALCPANITLDESRALVSLEAGGIAESLRAVEWSTEVLEALREPGYTSPEEAVGRPSPRADTFVLACIAYECLTGAPPFAGADDATVQAKILAVSPPSLRERRPDLDAAVDEVFTRAWRLDRTGSFEGAFAFAMALARALVCDASRRPTWSPDDTKHSGVRAIVAREEMGDERSEVALEGLTDLADLADPAQRQTLAWGEVPAASVVPIRPWTVVPPGVVESPEVRDEEPAAVASSPPSPEPPTVAPPSRYGVWAGEVSRPESPMASLTPARADRPAAVSSLMPEAMCPPPRTVPVPSPTPAAPNVARRARRSLLRPTGLDLEKVVAALPRAGLPAAMVLGVAMVSAAAIVTAGQVYVARMRSRGAAVERVTPGLPPQTVGAALGATQAIVAQRVVTHEGTAQPPAPLVAAGPAPTEARPAHGAVHAASAELGALLDGCVGTEYPGRRVRVTVRYDGTTGRARDVHVRGAFGRSPAAGCITAAARRVTYAPFGPGVWETTYSHSTRRP